MTRLSALPVYLMLTVAASAAEFKHVGDFLLQAHFKLTGQQVTPIPMKPIAFRVFTSSPKSESGVRSKAATLQRPGTLPISALRRCSCLPV